MIVSSSSCNGACGGADVQRRAAGDCGAAGVGPKHLHVVPVPVRGAVPRVGRVRARRRAVARRARLPRRRRRAALRPELLAHREYHTYFHSSLNTITFLKIY